MHQVPTTAFAWASAGSGLHATPQDHFVQQQLVRRWVFWLFSALVLPLLRSHFYVTDSEVYRNRALYFRKALWATLVARAEAALQEHQLRHVPAHRAHAMLTASDR